MSVCIAVQEGYISDGVELHLGLSTQQVHGSAQGTYNVQYCKSDKYTHIHT